MKTIIKIGKNEVVKSLPFVLRVNDVVKHNGFIYNVDSVVIDIDKETIIVVAK